MSTVTPSPEQSGAVRKTPPPERRSRFPLLVLLGLFAAVIVAGVVFLLVHGNSSSEPANRRVADTGSLPASAAPTSPPSAAPTSAATGGGAASAPSTTPSASATPQPAGGSSSSASVVGWVGGDGLKPQHATGGLAAEGSVGTVLFPTNSATLDADAKQVVVAVAAELKKQKPSSVRVTGYTDNVGTPGYNLALSARRAKAVADLLNTELPPGWVVSTGKGWADPVAPNTDADNRSKNRRTTITVT